MGPVKSLTFLGIETDSMESSVTMIPLKKLANARPLEWFKKTSNLLAFYLTSSPEVSNMMKIFKVQVKIERLADVPF